MKFILNTLCSLVLGIGILTAPAKADEMFPVSFDNIYAYATSAVQRNGAVFMTITNYKDTDVKITGVSTDVSDMTEMHTTDMQGDMMQMREVKSYDIPAKETVKLEPMGHHIMLIGLKDTLKKGEKFPIRITLEDFGTFTREVTIVGPGETYDEAAQ